MGVSFKLICPTTATGKAVMGGRQPELCHLSPPDTCFFPTPPLVTQCVCDSSGLGQDQSQSSSPAPPSCCSLAPSPCCTSHLELPWVGAGSNSCPGPRLVLKFKTRLFLPPWFYSLARGRGGSTHQISGPSPGPCT